jgi:glycosyltransferase involved in cell wall biosynthesis
MTSIVDVSVIISTFNRSAVLNSAILSLLRQQVPVGLDYEILIVDNNSSDDTRTVVERLALAYPGRLRYIFEPRQGVSYGRNAGIKAARAPIIAFTDDDNAPGPEWVATLKEALDRHPDVAAVGGRVLPQWPAPVPRWLDEQHWSPLAILDYGDRPFYTSTHDPRCLLTANLAVRRRIFERIGEFSPEFPRCQDHELLLRLWRAGERVLYLPELVVHTSIAPERLTARYHRRWHAMHGRYSAAMRLQEVIDVDGSLMATPVDAPRLYGTPGFVYKEMLRETARTAGSLLRLRPSANTYYHAFRVGYFVGYIRQRATNSVMQSGTRRPQLIRFVRAVLHDRSRRVSMKASRIFGVHLLMALLIGGSAYDIVTGTEHWPFSPYPMFSVVEREEKLRSFRLVGVTAEQVPREVTLLDRGTLDPFDQCRISTAFARTVNNPDRRPLTREMIRNSLHRYEELRRVERHDEPSLQALRLYRLTWTLDPDARNVDRPDQVELIDEVRSDGHGAASF